MQPTCSASATSIAPAARTTAARVRRPAFPTSGIRRSIDVIRWVIGRIALGVDFRWPHDGPRAGGLRRRRRLPSPGDADRRRSLLQLRAPRAAAGPAAVPPLALRAL